MDLIFIIWPVLGCTTMSVDKGRLEPEAQSAYETPESDVGSDGVLGRLKRHFDHWSRRYVELRVEARTGREH